MKLLAAYLFVCALGVSSPPDEYPGRSTYNRTCKNCHGPEGKGDPIADKFYRVTIPRLNSKYVQSKSDDELREIIMKGRRKMKPVEIGTPVATHKLDASLIPDVIAYVRSLKK